MRLKIRVLLFSIFATIVFLTATGVLFYFTGHSYDFGKNQIVKTGSVRVFLEKENANIFINEKNVGKKKDVLVNNLVPGTYTVKVAKENHQSWEKRITVSAAKTTLIGPIILFPVEPEKSKIFSNIESSVEKNGLFVLTQYDEGRKKYTVNFWDAEKEKTMYAIETENTPQKIYPAGEQMVVMQEKTPTDEILYEVYNGKEKILNLREVMENPTNILKTFAEKNDILSIFTENILWEIDVREKKIISKEEAVQDVDVYEGVLWCLKQENTGEEKLKKCKKDDRETVTLAGKNWFFAPQKNGGVVLKNASTGEIMLLRDGKEKSILQNMLSARVNKTDEKIVGWNDFEIWVYDQKKDEKKLLLRQSRKIIDIHWLDKKDYVVFSDEFGIHALELDTTDKNQLFSISKNPWKTWGVTDDEKKIVGTENKDFVIAQIEE